MEIIITEFYNMANPFNYSASVAEIGDNAGYITWTAAKDAEFNMLDNPDKLQEMRGWARACGGGRVKKSRHGLTMSLTHFSFS